MVCDWSVALLSFTVPWVFDFIVTPNQPLTHTCNIYSQLCFVRIHSALLTRQHNYHARCSHSLCSAHTPTQLPRSLLTLTLLCSHANTTTTLVAHTHSALLTRQHNYHARCSHSLCSAHTLTQLPRSLLTLTLLCSHTNTTTTLVAHTHSALLTH